ncbi:MAG: J domain-containing protein [Flavobacteriales bacterium]|nr:J domain-containing protein [Flavobacteriales bacterium]
MKDYFAILELNREAGADQVRAAYRRLAKEFHPDVNHHPGAKERFMEIHEAYEYLSDEGRRNWFRHYGARPRISTYELERREMIYKDWVERQQRAARVRAMRYAETPAESFFRSRVYRAASAVNKWFNLIFVAAAIGMVVVPLFNFLTWTPESLVAKPHWSSVVAPASIGLFFLIAGYYMLFVQDSTSE